MAVQRSDVNANPLVSKNTALPYRYRNSAGAEGPDRNARLIVVGDNVSSNYNSVGKIAHRYTVSCAAFDHITRRWRWSSDDDGMNLRECNPSTVGLDGAARHDSYEIPTDPRA